MKIVDVAQGSQEWLAWRREGITGTDMPAIMKESPYRTPLMVWREKLGILAPEDLSDNPMVLRGKRCEAANRRLAETLLGGEFLLPYCLEDEDEPLFRYSSDGVSEQSILVEIKSHSETVFREIEALGANHPDVKANGMQLQFGMMVGRLKQGLLLMCLNDEDGNVVDHLPLWRPARPHVWEKYRQAGRDFHALIMSQTQPELDPVKDVVYPTTEEQQRKWGAKAKVFMAAQAKLERLEKIVKARKERVKAAQAEIEALMGQHSQLACPVDDREVRLTRSAKRGYVDYAKLIVDRVGTIDPGVEDMYRKASGYVDYAAMAADLCGPIDQSILNAYRKLPSGQVRATVRNTGFQLPLATSAAA